MPRIMLVATRVGYRPKVSEVQPKIKHPMMAPVKNMDWDNGAFQASSQTQFI